MHCFGRKFQHESSMLTKLILNTIKNKDKVFKNYCHIPPSLWRFLPVTPRGVTSVSFCPDSFKKPTATSTESSVGVSSNRVRISNAKTSWALNQSLTLMNANFHGMYYLLMKEFSWHVYTKL